MDHMKKTGAYFFPISPLPVISCPCDRIIFKGLIRRKLLHDKGHPENVFCLQAIDAIALPLEKITLLH
jgi:hypothetical protein